jgi:hypothetical protein
MPNFTAHAPVLPTVFFVDSMDALIGNKNIVSDKPRWHKSALHRRNNLGKDSLEPKRQHLGDNHINHITKAGARGRL